VSTECRSELAPQAAGLGWETVQIAIPLFERLTALDAIGPYEVLSRLPGAEVIFVAAEPGPKRTDTGALSLTADRGLGEILQPDIVVVPGGSGTRDQPHDELVAWIQHVHQNSRWTTSVCTGALLLGAAGVLDGLRATTHWLFFDQLRAFGAEPTLERVVEEGKVVTAAGVSSGIDMALRLVQLIAGDEVAQAVQLSIEYDPQPPFDAGSPAKAPEPIVQLVRERGAAAG
jgi:transcriptional regulator GlxA family with amidase domain